MARRPPKRKRDEVSAGSTTVLRFSQLALRQWLGEYTMDHQDVSALGSMRWAKVADGRAGWHVAFEPGLPDQQDLVSRAKECGGEVVEAASELAHGDWMSPREAFLSTALQPASGPHLPAGRVLYLLDLEGQDNSPELEFFLQELERGWYVELERWEVGGTRYMGVAMQALEGAEPLRRTTDARVELYERLPGSRSQLYLQTGYRHPLAGLADALLPEEADPDQGWFRLGTGSAWRQGRRISTTVPLGPLVLRSADLEPVTLEQAGTKEELRVRVPLRFVVDERKDEERDEMTTAATVLRLDAWRGDALPAALLDVMDAVQAQAADGLDDVKYMFIPNDKRLGRVHKGATHFVSVNGPGSALAHISCDARYRQPQSFADAGLPVFLRDGYRFRPDLESMFQGHVRVGEMRDLLVKAFGIEKGQDGTFVLVDPGPSPAGPCVRVLKEGPDLRASITSVFDHWAPLLAEETQGSLSTQRGDDLDALTTCHEAASAATQAALADAVARFLSELEGRAKECDASVGRARVDLEALDALCREVGATLDSASQAWDELVRRVQGAHAALAGTVRDATRERYLESDRLLHEAGTAMDALASEQEQARDALARLNGESEKVAEAGRQAASLGQAVVQRRQGLARRVAAEEGRIKAVEQAREAASTDMAASARELLGRKAELSKVRDEMTRRAGELDEEIRNRTSDLEAVKKKSAALAKDLEGLQRLHEDLRREGAALREGTAGLESLREQFAAQQAEVEGLRQRAQECKRLDKDLRAQAANLRKELAALEGLQGRIEAQQAEARLLEEKVEARAGLEARAAALQQKIGELRWEVKAATLPRWKKKLDKLAASLAKLRGSIGRRPAPRRPARTPGAAGAPQPGQEASRSSRWRIWERWRRRPSEEER